MEERTFASLLRQFRALSGFKQSELAELIRISQSTLKNWERGESLPRYREDVLELEGALGLKPFEINQLLQAGNFELKYAVGNIGFSPPFQPLSRAEHFTGRKSIIERTLKHLQEGESISLCGAGGMGKTAIALEVVNKLMVSPRGRQLFPDGIVSFTFYGGNSATELVFRHIIDSYYENQSDYSSNAVRRLLSRKHLLIFLDGAEAADNLSDVLDVIPPSCSVLITSRNRYDVRGLREDVTPLSEDESITLLKSWCNDQIDNDDVAKEISRLVGHLPLALRLVGHYLSSTRNMASEYVIWLRQRPFQTLQIDRVTGREDNVFRLLSKSLLQIGEVAQSAISIIGLLSFSPFSSAIIKSIMPGIEGSRAIDQLVMHGLLLRQSGTNQLEVSHILVHTYSSRELKVANETVENLATYFIDYIEEQIQDKETDRFTNLDAVRSHILALLGHLGDRELWQSAKVIALLFNDYLHVQGFLRENEQVLETGLIASRKLNDLEVEAAFLNELGINYRQLGNHEKAATFHREAVELNRKTNDLAGEAKALGWLAITTRNLGKPKDAIAYHQQAIDIYERIGVTSGLGQQYSGIGGCYRILGQYETAIERFEVALRYRRESRDRRGEGADLGNLGIVYRMLGQYRKAIELYSQSLKIAEEIGYKISETLQAGNLGNVYGDIGEMEKSIEYLKRSVAVAREIGHRRSESNNVGNLGNAYFKIGMIDEAIACYQQALPLAQDMGFRLGESNLLGSLGAAHKILGNIEQAEDYQFRGLHIAREIGFKIGEADRLCEISVIFKDKGELESAIDYIQEALAISRQTNYRVGEGNFLGHLAITYLEMGDVDQAYMLLNQALEILRETNRQHFICDHLGNLGIVHFRDGRIDKAIGSHQEALTISREIKYRYSEGIQLKNLGKIYLDLGERQRAIDSYQRAYAILVSITPVVTGEIENILSELNKKTR